MAELADVSSGDVITAARQNDINDYISDGTHEVNTLFLRIGSSILVDSNRNITTSGSITSSGSVIGVVGSFNKIYGEVQDITFDSISTSNGSFTGSIIVNNVSNIGSLSNTGNITTSSGSFYGWGGTISGLTTICLPQGILPTGSIPSLTTLYIPQGVLPLGSLTNALPQGIIPLGSLTVVLPQGVLPLGSIPSLSGSYIPQGQLPTGSLPNTISISGDVSAVNANFSGSVNITSGSISSLVGSFSSIKTGSVFIMNNDGLNFYASDGSTLVAVLDNNGNFGIKGMSYSL